MLLLRLSRHIGVMGLVKDTGGPVRGFLHGRCIGAGCAVGSGGTVRGGCGITGIGVGLAGTGSGFLLPTAGNKGRAGSNATQQRFQVGTHLAGGPVTLVGIESTGSQHHLGQLRICVSGSRQGLTADPARQGSFPICMGNVGGIGRQERCPVVVQQPVQHHAQGVNIHAGAVGFFPVDLGSHVGVSALLGQTAGGLFHSTGNTEVTQLEIAGFGHEDILGLDIPVDDVVTLAQFQSLTDVDTQADHILSGHGMGLDIAHHGSQQLHTDENIPAEAVVMGDYVMVLVTDDVGGTLELGHQLKLPDDLFYHTAEVPGHAGIVHTLSLGIHDLAAALGNGDNLDGCLVRAEVISGGFINLTKAALTDEPAKLPLAQNSFTGGITAVHKNPPLFMGENIL